MSRSGSLAAHTKGSSMAGEAFALDSGPLRAQLARFEALFETVPLAIAVFDDAEQLVRANSRFNELVGHGTAAVGYGRSLRTAFPNAAIDLQGPTDLVLAGGVVGPLRIPFRRVAGDRVVEASLSPIPAEYGGGVLFMASDVTEREGLRAHLARSAAELESVFDVIPDSVRVFDAAGRIIRVNRAALADHPGARPASLSELVALDAPATVEGQPVPVEGHPVSRALAGEAVGCQELAVRRGDSHRAVLVEVSSSPMRDPSGRIIGAVTVERDVTDRIHLALELAEQVKRSSTLYERVSTEADRLERMVRTRTDELLALQEARARERRLTAVGQLAAGVLHDVNNALNPIMAASYLLEVNADNPAAVREYAARIARAAETGAATAARVGRFIRQDPVGGDAEARLDLSVVADEVIAMTRPMWAERVRGGRVELAFACGQGAVVSGVAGEIREALLNLVQNALDAMPAGGVLGITTRVSDDEAWLELSDTGEGMSEEVRERAFEPFFSTKGTDGSGLGLSEVYGIMKRHRGSAEIESAPGRGTTVRLRFPRAVAEIEPALQLRRPPKPRRVLLVEDNVDGREFMQALLESEGHTVHSVATVREALARLESHTPPLPYDVLVTDIGLPDGNGWDLVTTARMRWPELRVGVVTGWEIRTGSIGEADFTLRKPIKVPDFLARVAGDG